MDTSVFRHRFVRLCLVSATVWFAGCSGSGSASTSVSDADPPVVQPPADDPTDEPVDDAPMGPPTVNLTAAEDVVSPGDSVTLSWSSRNATSCSASGGWSGDRALTGSTSVGPVSQATTFTLTCSSSGGNAVAMISVSVLGIVSLEWEPPTENVDGSPLDDLAGYRIYYGESSGSYTDELAVSSSASTDYDVSVPSGSYYFAMTALDADGNESAYSNEVVKVVD